MLDDVRAPSRAGGVLAFRRRPSANLSGFTACGISPPAPLIGHRGLLARRSLRRPDKAVSPERDDQDPQFAKASLPHHESAPPRRGPSALLVPPIDKERLLAGWRGDFHLLISRRGVTRSLHLRVGGVRHLRVTHAPLE